MISKNSIIGIMVVLISLLVLSGITFAGDYLIGISQFVEHPALDAAKDGFIDGLAAEGFVEGENIEVLLENAQADFPTTQTIAQKFKQEKLDLILAIATPSAQTMANVIKDIPILITAVTDPVAAGLVDSMENPGRNVTGTTDMNPVAEQFKMIQDFIPDVKSVGILYNNGEVNSVVQVDIAKEVAAELGIKIEEGTVSNTSEVALATSSIVDKVDAFYIPTDNIIASAIASVLKIAHNNNTPVFGSESGMIEQGAIATKGIDYYLLGKQTGRMAAEVLNGKKPEDMPIEGSSDLNVVINKKSCEKIGLKIPEDILNKASKIYE